MSAATSGWSGDSSEIERGVFKSLRSNDCLKFRMIQLDRSQSTGYKLAEANLTLDRIYAGVAMQMQTRDGPFEGSCHCGNVRLAISHSPLHLIKCNCSICFRLGARWAHYDASMVKIEGHPRHTSAYVWGGKTLQTFRCNTCGCVTHWEALAPEAGAEVGINMNNFDQ